MNDKTILEKAFEFHEHICWASTIGVRAGQAALDALGVKRTGLPNKLHCILESGGNAFCIRFV